MTTAEPVSEHPEQAQWSCWLKPRQNPALPAGSLRTAHLRACPPCPTHGSL